MYYLSTPNVYLNYSNMSLMLSLETMFLPHVLCAFESVLFSRHLVVSFLLRVDLLEIWSAGCPRFFHVCFVLTVDNILFAKQSTGVHFVDRLCDFFLVIPFNADFLSRSFSLCNLFKYTVMSSSGLHGNYVSFIWSASPNMTSMMASVCLSKRSLINTPPPVPLILLQWRTSPSDMLRPWCVRG